MTSPGGEVVLVATPIGNLGDLSARMVAVLRDADLVCCEDTRRTRVLLSAAGVPAGGRLVSLHAHNEAARLGQLLAALEAGKTIAVVTDAGMPVVSDPGAALVDAALDRGFGVTVVPGPSAVLAALVVSGLPADRFSFEGFLPRKGVDRRARLSELAAEPRTSVVFESPARLVATLEDLAARMPERQVAVCRELTKVHEEVWRGTVADAASEFARRDVKGEVVLVLGGAPAAAPATASDHDVGTAVAAHLEDGTSVRDAASAAAEELGVPRRRAYAAAVAEQGRRHGDRRRSGPPR